MTSGRTRAVDNMHFFVPCQIDVANKQLFLHSLEITLYEKQG